MSLTIEVSRAYPLASKAGRAALRLVKPLDALRCALDAAGFREHGGFSTRVYYGTPLPDDRGRSVQ